MTAALPTLSAPASRTTATSFFDTFDCRSGHHCRTCRSRTTGHPFRSAIAAYFHLPSADFSCPHGRAWDLDSPAQPLPLPPADRSVPTTARSQPATAPNPADVAEAQRRFAICRVCDHSRDDGFTCPLYAGCCFGRFRGNPANHCPAGRW